MPEILESLRCVPEMDRTDAIVRAALTGPDPVFVSRIGGSDTDFLARVLAQSGAVGFPAAIEANARDLDLVQQFNGLYAKADLIAEAETFCRRLLSAYLRQPLTFVCNPPLLTRLLPDSINPVFQSFPEELGAKLLALIELTGAIHPVTLLPYAYVERTVLGPHSLFRLLSDILPGKRVLVVSPMTRSIEANFVNRQQFFRDYAYPEFSLVCLATPITYAGLPIDLYPDASWSATVARLQLEIDCIDFDIALLSCGSYAMPLGDFIARRMGRKAVYVGGCLQLFFGIMGRRYRNPFFLDVINSDYFIEPLEKAVFAKQVQAAEHSAKDAFGAYF